MHFKFSEAQLKRAPYLRKRSTFSKKSVFRKLDFSKSFGDVLQLKKCKEIISGVLKDKKGEHLQMFGKIGRGEQWAKL